jgi:hypothetical protein
MCYKTEMWMKLVQDRVHLRASVLAVLNFRTLLPANGERSYRVHNLERMFKYETRQHEKALYLHKNLLVHSVA